MKKQISRRDFLNFVNATALGIPFMGHSVLSDLSVNGHDSAEGNRILRIAHISDIHYQPFEEIPELFSSALRQIHQLIPPPDIIINTGDSIMDSLYKDKASTLVQWEAFNEIMAAECSLPVYHCIGNHDIWGWGYQYTDPSIVDDPLYGKSVAVQQLDLPGRYYSFDLAGWHFIMLDSMQPPVVDEPFQCYIGKLDDEQFNWLEQELSTNSTKSICILSHIPLLCACEFYDGDNERPDYWYVPAAWMHIDSRRTRNLFLDHQNVKLCLSGHTHQQEELIYLKVKYLTDGAVCGAWWDGAYLDFPPGYVVIDLYDNGASTSKFIAFDNEDEATHIFLPVILR